MIPAPAGRRNRRLTAAQEISLAKRVELGDAIARAEMVEANVGLVHTLLQPYVNRGVSRDDLAQEGMLGLIRAVEGFDWRRGWRFSTYATWWIRQGVIRAVRQDAAIRLPDRVWTAHRRIAEAERQLTDEIGRAPADRQIAKRAEATALDVSSWRVLRRPAASLDAADGPEGRPAGERLPDLRAGSDEQVERADRAGAVAAVLGELDGRAGEIVRRHYGLGGHEPQTYVQIAQHLSLSPSRVHDIERDAFAVLRTAPAIQSWRDAA